MIRTSKVVKKFGQWAVTRYGIECLTCYYSIEKDRLWEDEPRYNWLRHMAGKEWVNVADFRQAFAFAREHFNNLRNVSASDAIDPLTYYVPRRDLA